MPSKSESPAAALARRRWATTGTTDAHAAAARANGKLGGRPKKAREEEGSCEMSTGPDSRDKRAIEQIDCPNPTCRAKAGQPCIHRFPAGRVPCCTVRRQANQERLRAIQREMDAAIRPE